MDSSVSPFFFNENIVLKNLRAIMVTGGKDSTSVKTQSEEGALYKGSKK